VFRGAATVGHIRPGGDAILGPFPNTDESESESDEMVHDKGDRLAYAFYDDLQQDDFSDEEMTLEDERDDTRECKGGSEMISSCESND
jgi:hypothetical protein